MTDLSPTHHFLELRRGSVRALVRRECEACAGVLGVDGAPEGGERVGGGRAPHPVVALPGGGRAVVREYRRGGLMRHLNRARYFVGHRAMAELRATERARAAGARVPEVLAAVERRRGIGYTASLATRWVAGAEELAGWLEGRGAEERRSVLREVGRQVGLLHAGGVGHPDLNLRNFLVAPPEAGAPVVYVIDFDRATVYGGAAPAMRRARDLRRLARSARKLRAEITAAEWAALREGYGAGWPLRGDLG
jgi:3-deoxy-D-manno-octulosonic acid kinase